MPKSEPLYIEIRRYLLEMIEKNKNIPSFKLPSENQIAIRFNASRISAKKALQSLESEGFVYRQQGRGTFISPSVYRKNALEPSMSNDIVCMLMPSISGKFVNKIIEGAQAFLEAHHNKLNIMITMFNQEKEESMIKAAIQMGCKGIIIFPVDHDTYNNEILKLVLNRFPTVLVDRKLSGLDISYVACDHFNASYHATQYLISHGHKKIGFIGQHPESASSVADRIHGYEKAMIELVGEYNVKYKLCIGYEVNDLFCELKSFLKNNPDITAIITASGAFGMNLISAVNHMGKKIPQDMTLVFFDNEFDEYMGLLPFRPIIIEQNPYEIGYAAGEVLYQLMYKNPKPTKKTIQEKIIVY